MPDYKVPGTLLKSALELEATYRHIAGRYIPPSYEALRTFVLGNGEGGGLRWIYEDKANKAQKAAVARSYLRSLWSSVSKDDVYLNPDRLDQIAFIEQVARNLPPPSAVSGAELKSAHLILQGVLFDRLYRLRFDQIIKCSRPENSLLYVIIKEGLGVGVPGTQRHNEIDFLSLETAFSAFLEHTMRQSYPYHEKKTENIHEIVDYIRDIRHEVDKLGYPLPSTAPYEYYWEKGLKPWRELYVQFEYVRFIESVGVHVAREISDFEDVVKSFLNALDASADEKGATSQESRRACFERLDTSARMKALLSQSCTGVPAVLNYERSQRASVEAQLKGFGKSILVHALGGACLLAFVSIKAIPENFQLRGVIGSALGIKPGFEPFDKDAASALTRDTMIGNFIALLEALPDSAGIRCEPFGAGKDAILGAARDFKVHQYDYQLQVIAQPLPYSPASCSSSSSSSTSSAPAPSFF